MGLLRATKIVGVDHGPLIIDIGDPISLKDSIDPSLRAFRAHQDPEYVAVCVWMCGCLDVGESMYVGPLG
jgi:hypothetical protein